jgi:hypothetical protein
MTLCAGIFTPSAETVEAMPLGAVDELSVFISEFRTRGPGGADDEFIEIYNASGGNVDVGDWIIQKSSGCGSTETTLTTIPVGTILAPGQYYLVVKDGTYSGTTAYDRSYTVAGVADDGGIALKDDTTPTRITIDKVGLCADTSFKEGTFLAPLSGTANQSYERKAGGSAGSCKDTDNNSADFLLNASSSNPQNFSSPAVPCLAVINATSSEADTGVTYLDTSNRVIDIQLTFSNIVLVTGSPILLIETGVNDRTAVYVSGSGTNTLTFNYTVTPGDNTSDLDYAGFNALSLNGGTISGAIGDATLILPKPSNPGSLSANENIRIDNGAASPTLISFTRQNPTSQFTNADSITFRITFSDAMLNVDEGDFTVTGVSATNSLIRVENGRIYDFVITGVPLVNLNNTVDLNLYDPHNITNVGGIALPNAQPVIDEPYIVDNTPPSITFIRQAVTQLDPTSVLPINFDVSFSDAIEPSTFTPADIRQNGTATGITWSITNPLNDNQNFVLSAISTGAGTLAPSIDANRVNDLAGNGNNIYSIPLCPAIPALNDHCVTFNDTTPPTVTINQAAGQADPTSALPINFTVQFSEPINTATFTTADITQTGTAASVVWSIVNSGDNMNFTLSATSSGYGTLVPTIAINKILDLSGNNNTASTSTDNSVTYTSTPTPTPVGVRTVIINEIAWAGTSSSYSNDEWIELYNPGAASINITGWRLRSSTDGTPDILLSGTIPPGGYFLLEQGRDNVVSDIKADQIYTGNLSNSGEALLLLDGSGRIIDTANGNGGSWPAGSSSTYGSMERLGTSAENDNSWATNNGFKRNGKNANEDPILGTPKRSNSPPPTPTPTRTITPTPVGVRTVIINEIAWAGTSSSYSNDEWIELYNPGATSINITGWRLRSFTDSTPNILLSGTIPPGGYFLLEQGSDNVVSDIKADQIYTGNLSNSGEALFLLDGSGRIIDTANGNGGSWPAGSSFTYGTMERNSSSADSDSNWHTNTGAKRNGKNANNGDILGTPKASNSVSPTATPTVAPTQPLAPVVIPPRPILNEILARPGFDWNQDGRIDTFDEFIEIKNIAPADLNLSGWRLDDGLNEGSNPYTLPNITLRPGQRIALYTSQTNILLSDGGDTVRLLDPGGKVYDIFTYSIARTADHSFCRLPDGTPTDSAWADDCIPTPNLTNTREGMVPVMPGGNPESPVCQLPDTIPADFLLAECHGYGANIWNSYYWDQPGWQGRRYLPDNFSKWESFIE